MRAPRYTLNPEKANILKLDSDRSRRPVGPRKAKAERLREIRREIRRGGSAALDAAELLRGQEYAIAAQLVELSDWLLVRLAERRAV